MRKSQLTLCALSVRCLCVVCALSVRCLCAVCALSAPPRHGAPRMYERYAAETSEHRRGTPSKLKVCAACTRLAPPGHDASRMYTLHAVHSKYGVELFSFIWEFAFLLLPYRSEGPDTAIFTVFFPPMRYIAQRCTGNSSRVPLIQKMWKLCGVLPPPLLSDDKAPPVFNFPVGPEIHFSVPTVLDNERARFSCSRSQTLAHSRSTIGMYPLTLHSMIN